jgi:hypothetical protein
MKSAQWVRILTDGDVKDYKDILVAGKLNSPVYIKSHGSISHKSTMRFTKDQYLSIPEDVSNIMFSLFTDQLKPKEQLELQEEAAKLKNEIREYKDRKKSRLANMTYNDKCYLDPRENRITEIAEEVKSLELIDGQLRIPSFTSLNFITLGFELESIELNNLIEKAIKLNKSIDSTIKTNLFNFDFKPEDYKPEYSEVRRKTLSERTRITEKNIRLIDMKGLPRIQDYQTILTDDTTQWMCENAISSLEKEVSKKISDLGPDFKYNTAGSHYHRYIFMKQWERKNRPKVNESGKVDEGGKVNPTPNEKNSFNTPNYFKARFMYECCLEVIKSKGCFDLEDALSLRQRVGYYYDCYYHSIPYVERDSLLKSPTELLKSLGFVNLNHIIPGVMLNQDGDFWGIMTYMNSYEPPTLKKLLSRWQEDLKQTTCEDELAQWVVDFFVTPLKTDYLDKMFISDPCKIYPNFDDGPLYFFKDIKKEDLLFSETLFEGLIKKPYTYLKNGSHKLWNRAIIIQDYGISFKGTICSFIDSLESSPHTIPPSFMPLKICLIVSNIRYGRYSAKVMRSHLEKKSPSSNLNIQIDIHYLPPNLHNHHLHVYYKLEESKSPALTYIQSCYYYKRTTRNEMNGVYFEDSGSKFNHDGILRSGFRALSRSMWIASVIHEKGETISIDMVTDTTDKLHDLYLEFKKNVSAFNNLTRLLF